MTLLKLGPFARGELVTPCCGGLVRGHEVAAVIVANSPAEPVAGDLTVCEKCLFVLEFQADGTLRKLSVEELLELDPDEKAALGRVLALLEERRA